MFTSISKQHVRRKSEAAEIDRVTVDETGLVITVLGENWPSARAFEFFFLCPFACRPLAKAMALAFGRFASRYARSTASSRYTFFKSAWCAIAEQCEKRHLQNLRSGPLSAWFAQTAHVYLAGEFDRAARDTSAKTTVQGAEVVFGELASCGLLPDIKKVAVPKNVHLRKRPRKGLFELAAAGKAPSKKDVKAIVDYFTSSGVPIDDEDAKAYITSLATLLTPDERKDAKTIKDAYVRLSKEHLGSLTRAAESEFLKWSSHYDRGQALLEGAEPSVLRIYDANKFRSASDWARLFPIDDDDLTIANLLLLVRDRFNGIVTLTNTLPYPMKDRFGKAVSRAGGVYALDAMLHLHRDAVAAAAILYMLDTGANLSTALSLEVDFERPTSEAGMVEFFGVKARANYSAIYDVLPINEPGRQISTVKALRGVVDMTALLRKNFPELGASLFVFRFFRQPSVADSGFLADQLKYLLNRYELPKSWLLSAIRTAVGVSHALDDSRTLAGMKRRLNQKSDEVARGYALHFPIQKFLEAEMAKYQQLFQVGIAANLEGAFEWLRMPPAEAAKLIEEAKNKGLSFLLPSDAPDENDATPASEDDEISDPTYVFMTDEGSLSEVIATKRSLEANMEKLKGESTARFNELWIELLAFSSAVVESAKRSTFAYLMPQAERNAEKLLEAGFDITELRL